MPARGKHPKDETSFASATHPRLRNAAAEVIVASDSVILDQARTGYNAAAEMILGQSRTPTTLIEFALP